METIYFQQNTIFIARDVLIQYFPHNIEFILCHLDEIVYLVMLVNNTKPYKMVDLVTIVIAKIL